MYESRAMDEGCAVSLGGGPCTGTRERALGTGDGTAKNVVRAARALRRIGVDVPQDAPSWRPA